MRDINRIDKFCDELKEIWKAVPDWRFMQLVENFQRACSGIPFYIEDDDALKNLKRFVAEVTGGEK